MGDRITTSGAGLWPREEARQTDSEAERKVYRALASGLPEGWWAWHSLRLRSPSSGEHTEADFVLADPEMPGVIVLEVKGGQISQRDGRWYQYEHQLDRAPLEQAHGYRKVLLDCLKRQAERLPYIAVAACFPDCEFQCGPDQGDLRGLLLGGHDLPHLAQILPNLMARAVPEPWPADGRWLNALHSLWGETWVPEMSLGRRVELDQQRRLKLDAEQTQRLAEIEENRRLLILGGAGTGKTLLAREAALRAAQADKRVLMLCYTDALGCELASCIQHPNIDVAPIQRFAKRCLEDAGVACPVRPDAAFWLEVSFRAATDAPPTEPWGAIVVDEGQDFTEGDWLLVEECLRDDGALWVFADEHQAFWADRNLPESLQSTTFKVRLSKPYRCPPAIQHLADCYAGKCEPDRATLRQGAHDGQIKVISSSESKLAKQVGKEVNRLVSDGVRPGDIAVLSLRGRDAKDSIVHQETLGVHKVVSATDPEAAANVVCDTFLRFKGLERPLVLVTDLRLVTSDYEKRMHIAVSRATSALRVIGKMEDLIEGQLLSQ